MGPRASLCGQMQQQLSSSALGILTLISISDSEAGRTVHSESESMVGGQSDVGEVVSGIHHQAYLSVAAGQTRGGELRNSTFGL